MYSTRLVVMVGEAEAVRDQLRTTALFFRPLFVVCALVLLCAPAAQSAETKARPAPDADRVRIELRGVISPRCEFRGGDTSFSNARLGLGELTDPVTGALAAGSGELRFNVDCNHRFTVTLGALNGALVRAPTGFTQIADRDFHTRIPYHARLSLSSAPGARNCAAKDLQASDCHLRFPRSAGLAEAVLQISWDGDSRPVLAGRYSDRIIIKISPSVGGE